MLLLTDNQCAAISGGRRSSEPEIVFEETKMVNPTLYPGEEIIAWQQTTTTYRVWTSPFSYREYPDVNIVPVYRKISERSFQ